MPYGMQVQVLSPAPLKNPDNSGFFLLLSSIPTLELCKPYTQCRVYVYANICEAAGTPLRLFRISNQTHCTAYWCRGSRR